MTPMQIEPVILIYNTEKEPAHIIAAGIIIDKGDTDFVYVQIPSSGIDVRRVPRNQISSIWQSDAVFGRTLYASVANLYKTSPDSKAYETLTTEELAIELSTPKSES